MKTSKSVGNTWYASVKSFRSLLEMLGIDFTFNSSVIPAGSSECPAAPLMQVKGQVTGSASCSRGRGRVVP